MRQKFRITRSAIALTIVGLTGCLPSNKPSAGNGDCLTRMAEETASHIRDKKIPLKGADAELHSNKEEQVYVLSSQEPVKLNPKESLKNTVAVINHKEASGKSSFYLVEQEIAPDQITFVLKKNGEVLKSVPVKLILPRQTVPGPGVGNCESFCDSVDAENVPYFQAAQADANRTCSTATICRPACFCVGGTPSMPPTLYAFPPNSWRCWKNVETKYVAERFWALRTESPLLDQALDAAVTKEARLYSY
jgi:hypothetical protein